MGTQQRNTRTVRLDIPSELGWERVAMDVAGSVAMRLCFPPERVEDIKTAVSEAVLNAIEHGSALDATQRVVIVLVPEEEALAINVRDRSLKPFPAPADRDVPPSLEARLSGQVRPRGWGMYLIKELVDEVEFSSTRTGNVVRMVIHLQP